MTRKELWLVAEAESNDKRKVTFYIYRSGNSIYISGPNGYEHLCHPSVTDQDRVRSEILLVFHASVTRFTSPSGDPA